MAYLSQKKTIFSSIFKFFMDIIYQIMHHIPLK